MLFLLRVTDLTYLLSLYSINTVVLYCINMAKLLMKHLPAPECSENVLGMYEWW